MRPRSRPKGKSTSLRRLASSLLLATTVTAAALLPGAAVFAQAPIDGDAGCISVSSDSVTQAVQASSIIAVARVEAAGEDSLTLRPEALLKGSVSGETVGIARPDTDPDSGCVLAELQRSQRVFIFLAASEGRVFWPSVQQVFVIEPSGDARQLQQLGFGRPTEASMVKLVQDITGQYVIPAETEEEGQGIEWGSTILPIGLALGVVFVIGLFLMRIWHRIDPS